MKMDFHRNGFCENGFSQDLFLKNLVVFVLGVGYIFLPLNSFFPAPHPFHLQK